MTPVFGCQPLPWKTRIATVQDYNTKKKKKTKNTHQNEKKKNRKTKREGFLLNSVYFLPGQTCSRPWYVMQCAECVSEKQEQHGNLAELQHLFLIFFFSSIKLLVPAGALCCITGRCSHRARHQPAQAALLGTTAAFPSQWPPNMLLASLMDTASEGGGLQSTSRYGSAQELKKMHQEKPPPSAEASGHFRAVAG